MDRQISSTWFSVATEGTLNSPVVKGRDLRLQELGAGQARLNDVGDLLKENKLKISRKMSPCQRVPPECANTNTYSHKRAPFERAGTSR